MANVVAVAVNISVSSASCRKLDCELLLSRREFQEFHSRRPSLAQVDMKCHKSVWGFKELFTGRIESPRHDIEQLGGRTALPHGAPASRLSATYVQCTLSRQTEVCE
jgi:hypothetical protein